MRLLVKISLLLGFATVLIAAAALLVTDARLASTLACDKGSGVCSFKQPQLTTTWEGQVPIASIKRAEVRTVRGRGGSPQVWVVTRDGDYFFADYVLRPNADKVAQQINDFLGNAADARLDLTEDERASYWLAWALLPLSVILLLILGWVLFRNGPAQARTTRA